MKTAIAILLSFLLLAACSSDPAPKKEAGDGQVLKYEIREHAFDPAKTVEPPKKPASSLDQ